MSFLQFFCLGIKLDENFNWKNQISDIATKLNRANAILSKLRHFIDRKTLKSIYQAKCEPHFSYSSLVWAQIRIQLKEFLFCKRNLDGLCIFEIIVLKHPIKKSLRIINFRNHSAQTPNILKLPDKIALENFLFINKYFNKFLPTIFFILFFIKFGFLSHLIFIPIILVGPI